MRILLTFLLFSPMLVCANQHEQMVVSGECVYSKDYSVCFRGDAYIDNKGFFFDVDLQKEVYDLKGKEDGTRTR